MLKVSLWLAAIAAVVLVVLAFSRGIDFTSKPVKTEEAPAAEKAAVPAVAKAPETPPEKAAVAAPKPPEIDQQVAEDAAAVGMTTRQPPSEEEAQPKPPEAPTPK